MSLSKAEDQGVSARSDLAEIDDLNLTAPSPLQRLLSTKEFPCSRNACVWIFKKEAEFPSFARPQSRRVLNIGIG